MRSADGFGEAHGVPLYVPHEIFERKPLLGFVLGAVCLIFSLFAFCVLLREYLAFGKVPHKVDLKTVTPPPEMRGEWVVVAQPLKIYCEPVEVENQAEQQILFGRVESTYFQAEIPGSQRFVVLARHRRAACRDVQSTPLVGVLTELNPALRSTLEGRGMVMRRDAFVMLLCLSCGPKDSQIYLTLFLIMIAASLWLTGRSWRRHMAQAAMREQNRVEVA